MKYLRIVFEVKVEDTDTKKEMVDKLFSYMGDYISKNCLLGDIEMAETPYVRADRPNQPVQRQFQLVSEP